MKIHTIYFCYSTGFESKTSFKDELGVEAEEGNKMLLHLMTMSERHNYSAYAKGYQLFIYVLLVFISSIFACFFVLNDLQLNFYSLLVQWREIFPSKMGPFGSECFVDFGIALIFCKPKLFIVLNLL